MAGGVALDQHLDLTVRAIFFLSVLLIVYGTTYPFAIDPSAQWTDILPRFQQSLHQHLSRGDLLSNVVLYLPFGFFGMQSLAQRAPRMARMLLVCLLGAALSLSIECLQTFIVGRFPSVFDLVFNVAGTALGAGAGHVDWHKRLAVGPQSHRPHSPFPAFLLVAWLATRLFPYVPTVDFQHVKDAIKPLLGGPIAPAEVLRYCIASLVVGRLLQAVLTPRRSLLAMPLLVLGTVGAKAFLMTRVMSLSELIGSLAAVLLWLGVIARLRFRTGLLAALLALNITVQGLIPFTPADHPGAFSFLPFKGLESGSMSVNLLRFFEKIFLYGSLVWLLVHARIRLGLAIATSVALLTAIELLQTRLIGHVSEITDPLLAVILGGVLYALERSRVSPYMDSAP